MKDNEIIKLLECCKKSQCSKCYYSKECDGYTQVNYALDLITRQQAENKRLGKEVDLVSIQFQDLQERYEEAQAEIERLNKNYEELIYKTECLLCHATGNKFSKYTYTTQEMISFVDDYIQDCCDEVVEEAKEAAKSDAIKEFAEEIEYFILNEDVEIVKPKCKYYGSYINGANQFRHQIKNGIKKLVKEMEVSE